MTALTALGFWLLVADDGYATHIATFEGSMSRDDAEHRFMDSIRFDVDGRERVCRLKSTAHISHKSPGSMSMMTVPRK